MFQPKSIHLDSTGNYIDLDDLKHQLFLNENMTGKEILDQLDVYGHDTYNSPVLKSYEGEVIDNRLPIAVDVIATKISDIEGSVSDAMDAIDKLRALI